MTETDKRDRASEAQQRTETAFLDIAIRAAEQHAASRGCGWGPEVHDSPTVESTGLHGGDAGHGGNSSVRFSMPDGGAHALTLVLPASVWNALRNEQGVVAMPNGAVSLTLTQDQRQAGAIAVELTAMGDWEQDGLANAMRDAWLSLCRLHRRP